MDFFQQFTEGVDGTPSNRFYRKKKSVPGTYRLIGKPNEPMEEVQGRLFEFFKKIAPRCPSAAASKGGLGSVRNARQHTRRRQTGFVFKLDFSHAFDSTDSKKVVELIVDRVKKYARTKEPLPSTAEWHEFLSRYCFTRRGGLIQGASTSPLLLDWYCEMFVDRPIRKLLRVENRWVRADRPDAAVLYTRYVDDLLFSSPSKITRWFRSKIRNIVAAAWYLENHRKTEVGFLSPGRTVKITGVRIGINGQFGLARKDVKATERLLVNALALPLFGEKPAVIEGKALYLLDVLRGKEKLNLLEARTLVLYQKWCAANGRDAVWADKVLARKWSGSLRKRPAERKPKSKRSTL